MWHLTLLLWLWPAMLTRSCLGQLSLTQAVASFLRLLNYNLPHVLKGLKFPLRMTALLFLGYFTRI